MNRIAGKHNTACLLFFCLSAARKCSALRGYRKTNDNGPHPLNPPLPTLGEGEDLAKTLQKSSIFVSKTPPLPRLGEGVGG